MSLPTQNPLKLCLAWMVLLGILLAPASARSAARPAPAAVTIEKIEINQAVGVQKNNALKFVAGKPTVIRAFLQQEVRVETEAGRTQAVIQRDGQQVAVLRPRSSNRPVQVVDFQCPDLQTCGNWAAGNYVFNVRVNGVNHSTQGTAIEFQERAGVKILVVPVKACFDERVESLSGTNWKKLDQFLKTVYPLDPSNVEWKIRGEFDASDCEEYNLYTDDGGSNLWTALSALMPASCKADPSANGCYNRIVGFVNSNPKGDDGGVMGGFTYGSPTNIVSIKEQDAQATVAHEIAHTYGIGDAYSDGTLRCSVNPSYTGSTGTLWKGEKDFSQCTATRHPDYFTILVPAADHMYEVGRRGALPDMGDYMGSTLLMKDAWTSKFVYDYLFDQLAPATRAQQLNAEQRLVSFAGWVTPPPTNTVEMLPWETFTATLETQAAADGPYWMAGLAGETLVVTRSVEVQSAPPAARGRPTRPLAKIPFSGVLPFPPQVTHFRFFRDDLLLYDLPVSTRAPRVSQVTPFDAGPYSGTYTVTWQAEDTDGGAPLSFSLEYNPDVTRPDSAWQVLVSGLAESWWVVNFDELPGGLHARLRLRATDGVLTGVGQSAEFRVPFKAPQVALNEPEGGYAYALDEEVLLSAETFDLQDVTLPAGSLRWTSNLSGSLGSGPSLIVTNLPQGEHRLTVTVTNSAGLTDSDWLSITVGTLSYAYVDYVEDAENSVLLQNHWAALPTELEIPGPAVYTHTFFMYQHLFELPAAEPPGRLAAGRSFDLSAEVSAGPDWKPVVFSTTVPLTLTLAYPPLPPVIDPAGLRLYRWDGSGWIEAAAECAPASTYDRHLPGQLSVGICRLGSFALFGTGHRLYLPVNQRNAGP